MNVVQLVEEVKDRSGAKAIMTNEDVFLNTNFGDFIQAVVAKLRSA